MHQGCCIFPISSLLILFHSCSAPYRKKKQKQPLWHPLDRGSHRKPLTSPFPLISYLSLQGIWSPFCYLYLLVMKHNSNSYILLFIYFIPFSSSLISTFIHWTLENKWSSIFFFLLWIQVKGEDTLCIPRTLPLLSATTPLTF